MPKERTSPLTPQQIELLAFMRRTEEPIPHNPERLRALVRALIIRIHSTDEDFSRKLVVLLRGWTALELQRHESPTGDFLDEMDTALAGIIADWRKTKISHLPSTMSIQWEWLQDYLKKAAFPAKARNRMTQVEWVTCHSRDLLRELGAHHCLCLYPTSFEGSLPNDKEGQCKTIIQATGYLLAHFHNTTPSNLLKLMKPSQQHRITTSSPQTVRPSNK